MGSEAFKVRAYTNFEIVRIDYNEVTYVFERGQLVWTVAAEGGGSDLELPQIIALLFVGER